VNAYVAPSLYRQSHVLTLRVEYRDAVSPNWSHPARYRLQSAGGLNVGEEKAQLNESLVRERSVVLEPAETIPIQDSQSPQRELASIQQQLSHTQEKLADARQELIGVRSRQKSLVSELSLAISSLQQLRDQLHERDRSLTAINQKLDSTQKKLKSLRQGESVARDRLRYVKERLSARDQELADLRKRKLVRIAIRAGNLIHRWTSASALWQRYGLPRR
jgi:chromosome segregation ATPase